MIRYVLSVAAFALLGGAVQAQQVDVADAAETAGEDSVAVDLAANDRLVRGVTLADLEAIVVSKGHTLEASEVINKQSVRAADEDGLRYLLIGTACLEDSGACRGINMQVRYTYEAPQDWEALANANMKRAAASTWRNGNTIGVTRYVILDGGQTMENIKVNLNNLLAIAPAAFAFATGQDPDKIVADKAETTEAAAPAPTPEPVAAE